MGSRSCELISRITGDKIFFNSLFDADVFLKKSKGYTRYNFGRGKPVRNEYDDEYDVIIHGEKNKSLKPRQGVFFQQLCWTCKKAICGCNWSKYGKPVDGWDAEPTVIQTGNTVKNSYKIKRCPEYIEG